MQTDLIWSLHRKEIIIIKMSRFMCINKIILFETCASLLTRNALSSHLLKEQKNSSIHWRIWMNVREFSTTCSRIVPMYSAAQSHFTHCIILIFTLLYIRQLYIHIQPILVWLWTFHMFSVISIVEQAKRVWNFCRDFCECSHFKLSIKDYWQSLYDNKINSRLWSVIIKLKNNAKIALEVFE